MALNKDDMKKRRAKREAQRKQQQRAKKRLQMTLLAAVLVLGVAAFAMVRLIQGKPTEPPEDAPQATVQTTEAPTETTEPPQRLRSPITTIHIKAVGDLNVTNAMVQSGLAANGYDFTRAFQDVAGLLSDADLTVLNLEGNICGEPYGTQTASAPVELLTALRAAGVDMVQMANSYSIYNGLIGLSTTLEQVRNAGLEPLGAYSSPAQFKQNKGYTLCDIQGIKVAFVAFTKGVGGMGMPAGNEKCVNLLYKDYDQAYRSVDTDNINSILDAVNAERPDLVIAMLHWGSENNEEISKTQTSIVNLMKKKGVDVILGTHPHLVHKIEQDPKTGMLVAYSLGDFYGDGSRGGTNYSIILDLEITKDSSQNVTRVTNYTYTPIYTLKENECDGFRRVVRIEEAMQAYNGNHVDKVSQSTYNAMKYALQRIHERINDLKHEEEETTVPEETEATTGG